MSLASLSGKFCATTYAIDDYAIRRTRFVSFSSLFFFLSKTDTCPVPAIYSPLSPQLPVASASTRGAQKRPIVGTSGFRMNKHCLNRDSGSLGARVPSPLRLLSPPRARFHGRSAPKFVTSLPPTTLGAPPRRARVRWPFSKVVVPFYVRDSLGFVDRP